tara:strand:+ start:404 stop:1219 length:816 start_codon:yes stop_codon:yes gene_type:complete
LSKNYLLNSLLFFPVLYFIGWAGSNLLVYFFPSLEIGKSLYGTILTFLMFLIVLPYWCKFKWNKKFSNAIGNIKLNNKKLLLLLAGEICKSFLIILIISALLVFGGFADLENKVNIRLIFDSFFVAFLVGFAEELVFRVWLFEELNLYFNFGKSNILQSILFAILHIRWDISLTNNFQLILGLFLLGLYLNQWRSLELQSILLPISFHGSLVGFWFLIDQSILNIHAHVPEIIFGPGQEGNINPIGGLIGISFLIILNLFQNSRSFYFDKN